MKGPERGTLLAVQKLLGQGELAEELWEQSGGVSWLVSRVPWGMATALAFVARQSSRVPTVWGILEPWLSRAAGQVNGGDAQGT